MTQNAEKVARRFHEVYEYLAPMYSWVTQEKSQVPWEHVPKNQRDLMVEVVTQLAAEGVIRLPHIGRSGT